MIKRLDIFIDTDRMDQAIINILNYELGEVLLYNIEHTELKNKDEVKDYIGGF